MASQIQALSETIRGNINSASAYLQKMRRAKDDLLAFTEHTYPQWQSGRHHALICQQLERVERGEIDRLIIDAPPRHSKTEIVSKRFPAWYLGRHPDRQIINAAYGDTLASDTGADVRDIISDPIYQQIFPGTALRADAKAAGRWRTTQGGVYVAAGVGGPIVGRGAHLALIDDPFKGRAEAESKRQRQIVWQWYFGNLITRLMPGGAIVIIMTRWHEDDLVGGLLASEADEWTVLTLPAIVDEDSPDETALWPERYPLDTLKRIRESMRKAGRGREWDAQYQQRPSRETGTYCLREWFQGRYEKAPDHLNVYLCSDFAVTESDSGGRGPDYTEHGVFGVGPDDHVYVLDWWHGRTTADVWIERWIDLMAKYKPSAVYGEAGVIRRAIEPILTKRMRERKVYANVKWVPATADKATRGRAFQARASMKTYHFPAHAAWADRIIDQIVGFPGDAFDDAFDVCALSGSVVDEVIAARTPTAKPKKKYDPWAPKRKVDSWKVK